MRNSPSLLVVFIQKANHIRYLSASICAVSAVCPRSGKANTPLQGISAGGRMGEAGGEGGSFEILQVYAQQSRIIEC
jgi:hypothetical protein